MQCPKCHGQMDKLLFEGVGIERCQQCGGMWFDEGEREKLAQLRGSENLDIGDPQQGSVQNKQGDITCPRCHTRMVKMVDLQQPHVWYEMCSRCGGIYLDAGEFTDLKFHTIGDWLKRWFGKARM